MRLRGMIAVTVGLLALAIASFGFAAEAKKAAEKKPPEKKAAEQKAAAKKTSDKKPTEKKATVVRFTLKGDYPEGPSQGGLFGEMKPSLGRMMQRMEEAGADKDVAAVWLRIGDLELGRGKIHELRAAIGRIRKSGKPVYAELTSADTSQYLLATACDEVILPPAGTLLLTGVRAEMTFYFDCVCQILVCFFSGGKRLRCFQW